MQARDLCFLLFLCGSAIAHNGVARVAIVGGGATGAGTAAFLRSMLGEDSVDIHVFERNYQPGGRVANVMVDGVTMELGGSVYHDSNKYFDTIATALDLETGPPSFSSAAGSPFIIWDGKDVRIEASTYTPITMAKMFFRYGFSLFTARSKAQSVKDMFANVYSVQAAGEAYDRPSKLWERLGLLEYTQSSLRDELAREGISAAYAAELAVGIIRNNYGQNLDINAMAGYVGMIGTGGSLKQVKKGNGAAIEQLIWVTSLLETCVHVNRITRTAGGKYDLDVSPVTAFDETPGPLNGASPNQKKACEGRKRAPSEPESYQGFDLVVIAAPLEALPTSDAGNSMGVKITGTREFHTTYATFVTGQLRVERFYPTVAEPEKLDAPFRLAMTIDDPSIPFRTIGRMSTLNETHSIYKLFSEAKLTAEQLSEYFRDIGTVKSIGWKAYPLHRPGMFNYKETDQPPTYDNYELGDNLIYASSTESAASCIEVALVGAANAAMLACRRLAPQLNLPISSCTASVNKLRRAIKLGISGGDDDGEGGGDRADL